MVGIPEEGDEDGEIAKFVNYCQEAPTLNIFKDEHQSMVGASICYVTLNKSQTSFLQELETIKNFAEEQEKPSL